MSVPASLQARLILGAMVMLLACALLAGMGGYRAARHEADELFDAQLAQVGQTLLTLARAGDDDIAEAIGKTGHHYQTRLVFQVWHLESGEAPHLLLRSPELDRTPLPAPDQGYGNGRLDGETYRFYAAADRPDHFRVVVGQSLAMRQELVNRIAWNNAWPFLLVIPFWGLGMAWLVHRALAPVRGLAAQVTALDPVSLAPVAGRDVPAELRPLHQALNDLIGRLASAMENERRFTGDAAHELRTPIAALQAQLDAWRLAPDPAAREAALAKARGALERMSRLVTQLLTLARLEGVAAQAGEPADLAELARQACLDAADAALAKDIDLSLTADAAPMAGDPDALGILLRNLLDNALRHAPRGGKVAVAVTPGPRGPGLRVQDNGPGVPEPLRQELGKRFRRLDNADARGVGLGLSIVLRVAERHAARVEFGPGLDGQGLGVTVDFPG
jgi:two-component system sensor histidine kinase QseC